MKIHSLIIIFLIVLPYCLFGADVKIVNLKVEYAETPLGIDVQFPRFSWQMFDAGRNHGNKQTGYQLMVTDEHGEIGLGFGNNEG